MKKNLPDCFLSDEEIERGFAALGLGSIEKRGQVLQAFTSSEDKPQAAEIRIVRTNSSKPKHLGKGYYV